MVGRLKSAGRTDTCLLTGGGGKLNEKRQKAGDVECGGGLFVTRKRENRRRRDGDSFAEGEQGGRSPLVGTEVKIRNLLKSKGNRSGGKSPMRPPKTITLQKESDIIKIARTNYKGQNGGCRAHHECGESQLERWNVGPELGRRHDAVGGKTHPRIA